MIKAKMYGRAAQRKGLSCIPALDEDFLRNCIKGLKPGEQTSELMKEWTQGWTESNNQENIISKAL